MAPPTVLLALLFLLSSSLASPFPQESENDDDVEDIVEKEKEKPFKTELCDEFKVREFVADLTACEKAAAHDVNEVLASDDYSIPELRSALCQQLEGRLKCRSSMLPTCFDPVKIDVLTHNFLVEQFERAFNLTALLGRETIDDCPALVRNEDKVLRVLAGSDKCRFADFERRRVGLGPCMDDARDERDFRLKFISLSSNPSEYFVGTWCRLRDRFVSCREDFGACVGPDENAAMLKNEREYLEHVETLLRRHAGLDDFAFKTSCSDLGF